MNIENDYYICNKGPQYWNLNYEQNSDLNIALYFTKWLTSHILVAYYALGRSSNVGFMSHYINPKFFCAFYFTLLKNYNLNFLSPAYSPSQHLSMDLELT